jgi:elongation factor 1 alpha-like protein
VLPYLTSIGYKEKNVQFVPISGLTGLNLESRESQPAELKKWYNEEAGKDDPYKEPICLIEAFERFKASPQPYNRPARVCIYDYFNRNKDGFSNVTGDVLQVKVESGAIQTKDKLVLMPLDQQVTVKAIEHNK